MSATSAWRVREAGDPDAPALALVGGATFLESFAGVISGAAIVAHCAVQNNAETFRAYLAKGARAWIAEIDPGAAPVGYAMLTPPDLPGARDGDIELKRIYALSRFHGGGLGAALMDRAVAAARQGFDRLLLGVYAGNERALAFYAKHGFATIGTRRFDVGGTLHDDLVLARPLSALTLSEPR